MVHPNGILALLVKGEFLDIHKEQYLFCLLTTLGATPTTL